MIHQTETDMKTEIRTTESGSLELRVIVDGTCVLVMDPAACSLDIESMNTLIEKINSKINE